MSITDRGACSNGEQSSENCRPASRLWTSRMCINLCRKLRGARSPRGCSNAPEHSSKNLRNFLVVAEGQFGGVLEHQNFVLDTGTAPAPTASTRIVMGKRIQTRAATYLQK
jgi:hypothetical protein